MHLGATPTLGLKENPQNGVHGHKSHLDGEELGARLETPAHVGHWPNLKG